MVVNVVKRIGRIRSLPAAATASRRAWPAARWASMKSTRMMALLMTMPPSANTPNIAMNPIAQPVVKRPSSTPMSPKGTAARMTSGLRSELYCTVSTRNIRTIAIPIALTTCP